jgi:predicted DNA-binding transcriptional regulator AlpA
MRTNRVELHFAPRAMRLEHAAAYLSMSQSSFLRLIEERAMPAPTKIKGMTVWDRHDLDDAFEELKRGGARKSRNTIDELLGITDGEEG